MSEANEGAARRATALEARDIGNHQAGEKPKTGQSGASPLADPGDASREFQFTYRFGDHDWGIHIFANSPAEAREKIKAVALARYDGEVAMKVHVPLGGLIQRTIRWMRGI